MKSNLSKEDYLYLINKAEVYKNSYLTIKINDIRGEIKCWKILVSEGGRNVQGKAYPPIYKYAFKLFLNNIKYEEIYEFVDKNKDIIVDNIKYYLGTYTITNDDGYNTEIVYITYNLYNLNDFIVEEVEE